MSMDQFRNKIEKLLKVTTGVIDVIPKHLHIFELHSFKEFIKEVLPHTSDKQGHYGGVNCAYICIFLVLDRYVVHGGQNSRFLVACFWSSRKIDPFNISPYHFN